MDVVIYDGDCGLCTRVKETAEALDWFSTMRWIPNRSEEARRYGLSQDLMDHSVWLVRGGRPSSGFAAVQGIVSRLPLTWMIATLTVLKKPWTAALFAFLLSPLARPAGEPAYQWVARNRYRLPGSTCDNQIK